MGKDTSEIIADAIMDELRGRRGFRQVLEQMDEDDENDMRFDIMQIIENEGDIQ